MKCLLESQVVVIVGGASGIGLAIARAFAEEGARPALLDIHPGVSDRARELAREQKVPAHGIRCDMTDFAAVERAASEVSEKLGPPAHIVVAAAIGSGKFGFPFLNLSPSDWERVLRVDILGPVHVAHAFAPGLMAAKGGTITFLSSVAGQIGSQTDPPYSAAKAAVINFAQCVAKDLAPHGVRVNTLCPGMVKTELNRGVWAAWNARQPSEQQRSYEDWAGEKVRNVIPLGRWQEPEDIASMAVFLASERGRNITGQTINIDGGFVMHW